MVRAIGSKPEIGGWSQDGGRSGCLNRSAARAPKEYPDTEPDATRASGESSRKLSGGTGETSNACEGGEDAYCDPTEEQWLRARRPRSRTSPVEYCAAAGHDRAAIHRRREC
ncbi:hypothetical protein NDU88_005056 [Pleurodeles waltl]|uniref:Uncharacterized protein n=1 Tax=Pleurodeles waltl TaxID=8319 RepID=A0AAV7PIH5_PLEWA|nr:hypothetical protein NDU88_005056 [Pleurodeles waltl]